MIKQCVHWTAGAYRANDTDLAHYHDLIEGDGTFRAGKFPHSANFVSKGRILVEGKYCPHCGGGNSNTIGIGICSMFGFKNAANPGDYPMTQIQFEAACKRVAVNSKTYNEKITPESAFTHYEFGKLNPKTSSRGKIDIIYLPFRPDLKANEIGDFLREKANWYKSKL